MVSDTWRDWRWCEEEKRWNLRITREIEIKRGCLFLFCPRRVKGHLYLSVAGTPDALDRGLCDRANSYVAQLVVLEETIGAYLEGFPINVYGGHHEPVLITHEQRPIVTIFTIEIPNSMRPEHALMVVHTGYPDNYYDYEIEFESETIVCVRGRLS